MHLDLRQIWEVASAPDNVPIVALLFITPFFMWYALKQGIANDKLIAILEADAQAAKTKYRKTQEWDPKWEREVHTWPYLMRMEFLVAILVTVLLMVWSLTLNAPLEEPANPNVTMNPAKPPWAFLGGFVVCWVLMIIIGTFIRGPGGMWFWPSQTWDAERVDYAVNRNLDQVFGIDGSWLAAILHTSKDQAAIWARVIFGIFPLLIFFIAAAFLIHWICMRTEFSRKIY